MKKKEKNRNWILIFLSIVLFLFGLVIIGGKYLYIHISRLENDIKIEEFFDDPIEEEKEIVESTIEEKKDEVKPKPVNNEKYLAVLEITKIKFKRGIYAKNSKLNNVNKNVYLIKESDMPDKEKGNFILAGHSGTAYFSYFKNLTKLSIGDSAYVYYGGRRYEYKLVNNYEIDKNGKASIIRNGEKTVMTLITCKHGTEKQLVYIFERLEEDNGWIQNTT